MTGKGSVNHNSRKFHAKNTDPERSCLNVEYCNENIKDVYHELFDKALARYNEKQTRSDRCIDDYYEKICSSKQEKPFYEIILQIGNKDDMGAKTKDGQLAAEILDEYMQDFQRRNPTLRVFSAHLHMDEQTPHIHIDFVPFIRNSKRGLDTRVSLKGALSEQGFKGGTRGMTEWNEWIEAEKQELSKVMGRHGIQWKQLGTHNKHLSVLDFEKQERQKEVAELEQTISDSKKELADILHQQIAAGQETEQIRKEGEAIRQEVSELTATNHLLKEQTETLTEDKEKLLSENEKLEKQQKKLQQEINKMVQSKEVMERNIHAYDEDVKWQLAEPGVLMSAKNYRDKKALPLVEKLKEVVKNLTIKCVQLTEQSQKLTAKMDGQQKQISRLTDKVMEQSNTIDRLQEKASDLGRLERHLGREQVQSIVEQSKALEQAERSKKRPKRAFEMSR
ncbi:plasmid recombination protein [Candidatus Ventrimonas sp. KK005]